MNHLTRSLLEGLLEEDKKIVALYGGGFKPPIGGHFEVVEEALKQYPEIDELIILVGSGERNGISQAEAILIWEIYQDYLSPKVKIQPSKMPIGDIYSFAKNNPQDVIYWVIGRREGADDDDKDIIDRAKGLKNNPKKYDNLSLKIITTQDEGMRGRNAREAAKKGKLYFTPFLPKNLSKEDKSRVFDIVSPVLNENATYSQNIDYKQMIQDLTDYMIEKGRNIEPLPKVEFIDGDVENAKKFLGKTAYYDPNTQTIVLYTEGRHPKDIVRSFSHEMVHHTQFLEGRLDDIQTTDTTKDDNLEKIEQEANLVGTMTFRNFTDSLNNDIEEGGSLIPIKIEKPKPDPFGINAYALELAKGLEEELKEGDTYEKMAAKGKKAGSLKQGTVRKRLGIPKDKKIPLSLINKEISRLKKMDKDPDKKGAQLGDKNQKYYKALQLAKTLKTTTNVKEEMNCGCGQNPCITFGVMLEADPKKGTGKKPKGSGRRLYTDEDPTDTVKVKFSTRQDIVDTLNKKSFKAKSHARQSQIINLIHQRVRAALGRTKDPKKKKKLQSAFSYIKQRKESSKKKTQRLKKKKLNEKKGYGKSSSTRYRAIYKKDGKFYFMQDNPFSPGIRQEFGPYKTKEAALKKMGTFPPGTSYRDITEYIDEIIYEKLCKRGYNYIAKRKRQGEKHNPFLTARAVKVCKGQMSGTDGKQKKDFRPKKGKKRSAQGRKPNIIKEIGIDLSNYDGQILPGDVLRAPKGFPLGGKKLEKSLQLKVIKNSREGVNRYKLSLEDKNGKKYSVRNYEMDGKYKGKKLPKWGLIRKSKKNITEQKTYKIYSDMDGVLVDFNERFKRFSDGIPPIEYEQKFGKEKFWELIDGTGVRFWVGMDWMSDGKQLWNYIKKYEPILLSSPSRSNYSRMGKRIWRKRNLPSTKLILAQAANKQNYADPDSILIDDRESNIDQWIKAGGIGILHTNTASTINKLKELGL